MEERDAAPEPMEEAPLAEEEEELAAAEAAANPNENMVLACMERMRVVVKNCVCHNYGLRNLGLSVGTGVYCRYGDKLCEGLSEDYGVAGNYFVCAWACAMFSSFGPMVVHHLQGVVGMMIHVPLYPIDRRAEFLMVVSQLGALGALPCHYLRKMEISVEHNITRFYAPDWFLESVNLLYDWTREQRREAFGQMDDQ